MNTVIGIGDVIRAWRALNAATEDECRAIARLLGFDLRERVVASASESLPTTPVGERPATRPSPEPPRETSKPPSSPGDPIELIPLPPVRDDPQTLPASGIPLPASSETSPLESLFAANWARAIASTLCSRCARVGAIDIRKLVELIVSRRALLRVPRLPRMISATEIVVAVDRSGTISWFRDDVDQLVGRLDAVTRAPVTVVRAQGAPGVVSTSAPAWSEEDEDAPPAVVRAGAGSRIVGITDLGMGSSRSAPDNPRFHGWVETARQLRARSASLVIVTPVRPARIPAVLRNLAPCVYWDGQTRPTTIHRLIKGLG